MWSYTLRFVLKEPLINRHTHTHTLCVRFLLVVLHGFGGLLCCFWGRKWWSDRFHGIHVYLLTRRFFFARCVPYVWGEVAELDNITSMAACFKKVIPIYYTWLGWAFPPPKKKNAMNKNAGHLEGVPENRTGNFRGLSNQRSAWWPLTTVTSPSSKLVPTAM